jgi:hypothetical protein
VAKNVIGSFDNIVVAHKVIAELVESGFARASISLISSDTDNQYSRYIDKTGVPKKDAVTAADGAGFGTVVGALTGVLASMAALSIPGIGLAIVAGPIVAGITGGVAGAITGSIVGALVKSGLPEDEASSYAESIRRGGTIVTVETADSTETLRAEDVMNRNNVININERSNTWRQEGWQAFDEEGISAEQRHTAPSILPILPVPPLDPLMGNGVQNGDSPTPERLAELDAHKR